MYHFLTTSVVKSRLLQISFFLTLVTSSHPVDAQVPTTEWTGQGGNNLLTTPGNWYGNAVPGNTDTTYFDSAYPSLGYTNPSVTGNFTVGGIDFINSASTFSFTTNTGTFNLTGSGITGNNTNTQLSASNTGTVTSSQILFNNNVSTISVGSANLSATNNGPINDNSTLDAGQITFEVPTGSIRVTIGDGAIVSATNSNTIKAQNGASASDGTDAGQILFDTRVQTSASSITCGNGVMFTADNTSTGTITSAINGSAAGSSSAQFLLDNRQSLFKSTFVAGSNTQFSLTNNGIISVNALHNGDAGQMVVVAYDGAYASFMLGNDSSISATNTNTILSESSDTTNSFDAGQVVFDGDSGGYTALIMGDGATINVINSGSIETQFAFADAAQLLFDGRYNGGSNFQAGNNATIILTAGTGSLITVGTTNDSYDSSSGQLLFDCNDGGKGSFTTGNSLTLTASNSGVISGTANSSDAGQVMFIGYDGGHSASIMGDGATIDLTNNGTLEGQNNFADVAQLLFDGRFGGNSSFKAGDNTKIILTTGTGSMIKAGTASEGYDSNSGQLLLDCSEGGTVSFAVGNYFTLTASNNGTITNYNNLDINAGQVLLGGDEEGNATFTTGSYANLNLTNDGNIQGVDYYSGQLLVLGHYDGYGSMSLGDNSFLTLTAGTGSNITLGYNSGQLIVTGLGEGKGFFSTGNNTSINVSNLGTMSSTNVLTTDNQGASTAQILVDGSFEGSATFTTGSNNIVNVVNSNEITGFDYDTAQVLCLGINPTETFPAKGSFIIGNGNTFNVTNTSGGVIQGPIANTDAPSLIGQFLVDGWNGNASLSMGTDSTLLLTNNGTIASAFAAAGQFVCSGVGGGVGTVTGDNTATITAINNQGSIIVGDTGSPVAQFLFIDATINGNINLQAINNSTTPISGIYFSQNCSADNVNIILQNSSLVVNTSTPSTFTIGSIAGDPSSQAILSKDLAINTNAINNNPTFYGVIRDAPATSNNLFITGNGAQVLAGANTYGGSTIVNGGNLILTGSVAHDVNVNGGILSGTGTVLGNLNVNAGGTVNPGIGLGTLHVNQTYTQYAEGTFLVNVTGAEYANGTPKSNFLMTNTAALAGNLTVTSIDGTYSIGRPYTVLSANSRSGTYNLVNALNPFLDVTAIYNPDPTVQIILATAFERGAKTTNELNVAQQIDGIALPDGIEAVLINNLLGLSSTQLPNALDDMSGEQYANVVETSQYANRRFSRNIYDQLRSVLENFECPPQCCQCTPWITFDVGRAFGDSNKHATGYHTFSIDASIGVHTPINDCIMLGLAANYEFNHLNFNVPGACDLYTGQGAIYGTYKNNNWYLFSNLIISQSYTHIKRHIKFNGIDETAKGKPDYWSGLWYGECGYDYSTCGVLLQPFVGYDVGYTYGRGFDEKSAGLLNLHIDKLKQWYYDFYLGTHFSASQGGVLFSADFAWVRRFGSSNGKVKAYFLDFGDTFSISSPGRLDNGFIGNFNVMAPVSSYFDFYADFAVEMWKNWTAWSGSLGISRTF